MTHEADGVDRWGDRMMRVFWRKPAATVAERTRRRVTLHLVPYLFFLYILAYVDRMNVAVAKLGMTESVANGGLGFDDAIIGIGAGMFFWGYWVLEIPSTLWTERRGARWVFVRILILWGIVASLMGGIGTPAAASIFHAVGLRSDTEFQFYAMRFMLGFFEGGFFPSVIVYLSHWFRATDRGRAFATFAVAMPLAAVLGYTFSAFFLNGFSGWRWIFVCEGIPPILAGFATIFMLPDEPPDAKWLPPDEQDWLLAELEQERQQKLRSAGHFGWQRSVFMVLLLTLVYFCQNVTAYGLSYFMPTIMKSQLLALPLSIQSWLGISADVRTDQRMNVVGSLLATLPYYVSIVALLLNGRHSDKTGERAWHVAVPLVVASLGILAAWALGQSALAMLVMILVVGACIYTHIPPFWSIPTMFLGAGAAASAIGFINMMGNLGSGFGPTILGEQSAKKDIIAALIRIVPWSFVAAILVISMDSYRKWRLRSSTATSGNRQTRDPRA